MSVGSGFCGHRASRLAMNLSTPQSYHHSECIAVEYRETFLDQLQLHYKTDATMRIKRHLFESISTFIADCIKRTSNTILLVMQYKAVLLSTDKYW